MYMLLAERWNAFTVEPYCRHILWRQECGLFIPPKLCTENIKLTPYSITNVKTFLLKHGLPEAAGTAQFCPLMDMFFNIMNIRDINSQNMSLSYHVYHCQKLTIYDFHGFEMFSCNILKIGWHALNSIQEIFLEMQKVICSYPIKHIKDLKLQ